MILLDFEAYAVLLDGEEEVSKREMGKVWVSFSNRQVEATFLPDTRPLSGKSCFDPHRWTYCELWVFIDGEKVFSVWTGAAVPGSGINVEWDHQLGSMA
jgi:hypothetical protein